VTTFYLIRHGNIDYNSRVPGRQAGLFLSEDGRNQASSLVERFNNIHIDAIYSSPLQRAVETATPLAVKNHLPIETLDELNEIEFGRWTGFSFDDLERDMQWKLFHSYRNGCKIPFGETMIKVQQRMINVIIKIHTLLPRHNVLIFSHNDPIKSIIAYFCGIPLDQFLRVTISTGSVSAIYLNNNDVKILFVATTGKIPLIAT
jgi:broad specificity phosphatase PhoE